MQYFVIDGRTYTHAELLEMKMKNKEEKKNADVNDDVNDEINQEVNDEKSEEVDKELEKIKKEYEDLFGRVPHHLKKKETLIQDINEKKADLASK